MTPQEERIADRLAYLKRKAPRCAGLFERVFRGKVSKSQAVKATCLDCCCYSANEVKLCVSVTCPLWRVRPFQGKARLVKRPTDSTGINLLRRWRGVRIAGT